MTRYTTKTDVAIRVRQLNESLAEYGASVSVVHIRGSGHVLQLWEGEKYIMDLSPTVTQAVVCHLIWAMRGTLQMVERSKENE